MQGSEIQWFPVICQGMVGIGESFTARLLSMTRSPGPFAAMAGARGGLLHATQLTLSTLQLKRRPRPAGAAGALLVALGCALAFSPAPAAGQRALGPADDATVVPRGLIRIGVQPTWGRANERFSDGLGGRTKGEPERLGIDYDVDSLGPARFEPLRALTADLRVLTGKTDIPSTLGRLRVDFDASTVTTPIAVEYGLTRRITLGLLVPYVKTRNEVSLIPNPDRTGGTMGVNPSLRFAGARARNLQLSNELTESVTRLNAALASCQGSNAPECSAINADRARAAQLAADAAAVAAAVGNVYGTREGQGARFAPVEGSRIQTDIAARLSALSGSFSALLGAPTGREAWILTRPVGAPLMGLDDFTAIVSDSAFGIAAVPLETVERSHIGDVEAGIKVLLYDGLGARPPQTVDYTGLKFRVAAGAVYRRGTAQFQSADDFADIGTGDAQDDIEGRLFADVLVGRRFWASFVGRYGVQQADAQFLRIPDQPNAPFAAGYRKQFVSRDLGDYFVGEFTPRVSLSDALMFTATYSYYSKGEDAYTGQFPATTLDGGSTTLDASILNAGTARTEQRLVGGFTYSTMAAYYRGRAKRPLEVSYVFGQSLGGSGQAMKTFTQAIGLRLYIPLFAAPEARPRRR